ncbi:MAG: DUF192 domain-containing protein [Eubacteriales bacterium]
MALCNIICEDKVIARNTFLADSFFTRLTGLLRSSSINDGEGLLLSPCRQIHTYGMKFDIDAVFLDRDMKIIDIFENIPPGRMSRYYMKGRMVLELPAGTAKKYGLSNGMTLIKQNLLGGV